MTYTRLYDTERYWTMHVSLGPFIYLVYLCNSRIIQMSALRCQSNEWIAVANFYHLTSTDHTEFDHTLHTRWVLTGAASCRQRLTDTGAFYGTKQGLHWAARVRLPFRASHNAVTVFLYPALMQSR
jgi:hypothetical protein